MDSKSFYDDISNCIQAIVYKFGTPDSVEKYKSKINFYYNKTTESKVKVELFFKDKIYIVNTNNKKYCFNIKETEYYQNIRRRNNEVRYEITRCSDQRV